MRSTKYVWNRRVSDGSCVRARLCGARLWPVVPNGVRQNGCARTLSVLLDKDVIGDLFPAKQ
jgi:hypothetical protein